MPFFLIAFFILLTSSLSAEETLPFRCKADYLEYIEDKEARAEGNVRVYYRDMHISAHYLHLNLPEEQFAAKGDVTFIGPDQEIRGEELSYDFKTKSGEVRQAHTYIEPVYYRGKNIRISPEGIEVLQGYFTTCDLDTAHYTVRAKKINLYLKNKIIARDVFIYAGNFPLFYVPILAFSFLPDKFPWLIPQIGHSEDKGWYVKGGYNYPLGISGYGDFFLEYMQRKGWGLGLNLDYLALSKDESERANAIAEAGGRRPLRDYPAKKWQAAGSLYYVREKNDKDRYMLNLRQRSARNFVYLHTSSDTQFSRDYGTGIDWAKREFRACLSHEEIRKGLHLRLDVEKETDKEMLRTTLPRIRLSHVPFPWINPALYGKWSLEGGNYYIDGKNRLILDSSLSLISQSLFLTKRLSLSSSLDLGGIYAYNPQGREQSLLSSAGFGLQGRYRLSNDLTARISYHLGNKILRDTFPLTLRPHHYLKGSLNYENKNMEATLSAIYKLTRLPEEEFPDNRLSEAEFSLRLPLKKWQFYHATKYYVYKDLLQHNSYLSTTFAPGEFSLGFQYLEPMERVNIEKISHLGGELNFRLGKYRFTIGSNYSLNEGKFTHRDYQIGRDLHCWEASLTYRELTKEIWFEMHLKAFPGAKFQFHPRFF